MLGSERAYRWVQDLKQNDPDKYNELKSNIDNAFVTIKKAFRDNALTKGCVELYFTDDTEYAKRKEILTASLADIDAKLCELQSQRSDIVKSLEMLGAILGQTKVDVNSAIREGMKRTHELKGRQVELARQVLEQQKQVVAEKFGDESAKAFVEQQATTTVVKRKKKAVVEENDSD